jgi:membrane complex biogenesis BtpA family protein
MNALREKLKTEKVIIGMVHLHALPGSPKYQGDLEEIYEAALKDLRALEKGGAGAVIIENFGDVPYAANNELINKIAFASMVARLRRETKLPVGINYQFNDVETEWAVAYNSDVDFIRCEVFAENRVGPNGLFIAAGPELMRMKAHYNKDVMILADANVKHTFALAEQPLDFTIESLIEGGADGIIVTGITTGVNPSVEDVKLVNKHAKGLPVFLGSGINDKNVNEYLPYINGAIVGSSLKKDHIVENPVDLKNVKKFMSKIK